MRKQLTCKQAANKERDDNDKEEKKGGSPRSPQGSLLRLLLCGFCSVIIFFNSESVKVFIMNMKDMPNCPTRVCDQARQKCSVMKWDGEALGSP